MSLNNTNFIFIKLLILFIINFYIILNFINIFRKKFFIKLTYKESIDYEKILFIINSDREYKEIEGLDKNTIIKNLSSYSYIWESNNNFSYINFTSYLPKSNNEGYRNLSNYDLIYFNIYSNKPILAKYELIIKYKKSSYNLFPKNSYKTFILSMNFSQWKEIVFSICNLNIKCNSDLSRVISMTLVLKNISYIKKEKIHLYIDKFFFAKKKFIFNMKEKEINEDNYLKILNKVKYILVYKPLNKIVNLNFINRLKNMINISKSIHKEINKTFPPFGFLINSSKDMFISYSKIKKLVLGYSIKNGELFKNKTFLNDIIYSLDYMHDNYYIKRNNKSLVRPSNWWHWDIGIPQKLVEILVCLKDELSDEEVNKYLFPLNKYIPFPSATMANRVDIAYSCIISGALQHDYKRISISVEMIKECFKYVEKDDGFYHDGSYIQHSIYGYNGAYGSYFISAISKITYILEDTIFEIDNKMKRQQYQWIINSYLPFMYDGAFFDLIRGRAVVKEFLDGLSSGSYSIDSFCLATSYIINKKELKILKSILKNLYKTNKFHYINSLSIYCLNILEKIKMDKSIPTLSIDHFAKIYSRIDKAIAQVNGVGIGISMSSKRTGKYESINEENKRGWYQGDGMTYIYLSPLDYANSFWPFINYYRLGGTTVTTAPRKERSLSFNNAQAKDYFVGGTYYDINMVCAMKFSSENPGVNFKSTLKGNKSYFIFGGILICLGNNISSNDNYGVETIIENRKLKGKFFFGEKQIFLKNGNVTNNYIYIENYGGIFLPDINNVKYNITKNNFLEIYFDHGKKTNNISYKYYIVPNVNYNNFKKLIKNIDIICNNKYVSVVNNKSSNIFQYIFWEKGKFNEIEVDNPCTLIINKNNLYISDPTQKLKFINITFRNKNYKIKLEKGYTFNITMNK